MVGRLVFRGPSVRPCDVVGQQAHEALRVPAIGRVMEGLNDPLGFRDARQMSSY